MNFSLIFNQQNNQNNILVNQSGIGTVLKINNIDKKILNEYKNENLIYPSILDGLEFVHDPQWADILHDAAYGIFPSGFASRNDGISCNVGGKRQSIIPSIMPEIAVDEVIEFFRSAGGIKTKIDIEMEQRILVDARRQQDEEYETLSWSKLKSGMKNEVISYFASNVSDKLNLSQNQRSDLETVVNSGLNSGAIRERDIIFANGKIIEIIPLYFDGNYFHLTTEAILRSKLPIIKNVYSDDVYFDPNYKPPYQSSRKFNGFDSQWQKMKRNINKSITRSQTNRATSIANLKSSPSPYNSHSPSFSPHVINSIRNNSHRYSYTNFTDDDKYTIEEFKPTEFMLNISDPLLSPRPLNYYDRLKIQKLSC